MKEMEIFAECQKINGHLQIGEQGRARNDLIKLLDYHEEKKIEYTSVVNHLIRETGLYPYIKVESALWQDRFVCEAFKVDVGQDVAVLHREQSSLLAKMIEGRNIAISAPTSFGKSFVIDAFIALKRPSNVVIIVPTIALTDETRRRLYRKFSDCYKIITTSDVTISEKNIFVFPQERAFGYLNKIESIDLLIVDEFYKASSKFDKERSPILLKAIIKLGKIAKQKYFLAPNIQSIKDNIFTNDMEFVEMLNFNTVYLEKHELYKEIKNDERLKSLALLQILKEKQIKSLIYAGTYTNIDKVSNLLIAELNVRSKPILDNFSDWLALNYDANWKLVSLARRATGIHNGKLHRSLSQIQIRLFEEMDGFDNIISTSSIIEGVNTSAENVIIWRNKIGASNLNDFTYKNIIGRGGRMFRHFIGKIYLLESPPLEEVTQLEIPFPDSILGDLDENTYEESLTTEQIAKIVSFKLDMQGLLGKESYDRLAKENVFQLSNSEFIREVARAMKGSPDEWNGFSYLNSDDVERWDRFLYKIIGLIPGGWETSYTKLVAFIKILSKNWTHSIPQLLKQLDEHDIDIDAFFKLERVVSFKFSALLADVNELQKVILKKGFDVAPFVAKLSHAFLPSAVYQLEEYGLPRMVTKKIHQHGAIDFEDETLTLHKAIEKFKIIGQDAMVLKSYFDDFDRYILKYFYNGITIGKEVSSLFEP